MNPVLQELYDSLPTIECKKLCAECCGPIAMTSIEWRAIRKRLGFKAEARRDLACPMLRNGLCRVYDIRPMICRLWGVVDQDGMRCGHGCEPTRWLTKQEGQEFLLQASIIAGDVARPTTHGSQDTRG